MGVIEFFTDDRDLVYRTEKGYASLSEDDTELIRDIYEKVKELYPEAFAALQKIYSNSAFFKFLYVRRFLKCNLGVLDDKPDIRPEGTFRFEHVPCPLRGECLYEKIICHPKLTTVLTKREIEVGRLIAMNMIDEEIGARLFISLHTVQNHRKHIEAKLGLHNKQAVADYFKNNNI